MKYRHTTLAVLCCLSLTLACIAQADPTAAQARDTQLLLSRLDISKPGLEKVKAAETPAIAARELLAYYRARTSVKHPTERPSKIGLGKGASAKDIKIADDALQHILRGQPSYPAHFRGEDIDWDTNPVADKEWIWQMHRMGFWEAMAKAYVHTGDEKYAQEWALQLTDWVRKNPRTKGHEHAWRSIEAGIRGYNWGSLFQLFLDSPSFTPEVLVTFLNSSHEHAAYLMTKYSKGSNWALMEAEGLAFIAMTFPEFTDSEEWTKEAIKRLSLEIHNQVYADGHQRELALGYHQGCISWFMRTLDLAEMNGKRDLFPVDYLLVIEKMCAVVMEVSFPDGSTPQFGDSWSGRPGATYSNLKRWGKLFDRQDLLYVASEGKEGVKPKSTAIALKESGFYTLRSGWDKDAICMILKCGPDGGGHCQPDNGTFEICAGGRQLMPDSGSYIYSGDPVNRNWFRATRNHQTLTLNEKNSAFAPKLLLWQPGEELDLLVIENASYQDLTHRRTICFVDKEYFVIIDEALGKATGNVDLNFQLAPGKALINTAELSANTDFDKGWNVLLQALSKADISMEEVEGRVSFKYTVQEPRPAFRYRIKKEDASPIRFITLLAPYSGKAPTIAVNLTAETEQTIGSKIEFDVIRNGAKKRIRIDATSRTASE